MKILKWFIPALLIIVFAFCVVFLSKPLLSQSQDELETTETVEETPVYDDIATIYYYGHGDTRIHTWLNTGNNSFTYSGSNGWFSTKKGGYEGNKLLHSVSGDWNGDGYSDIAGFYDYGQGVTRIHVWLNEGGTTFNYQTSKGWWDSARGYEAKNIVSAIAGDYDGDGNDDIAAFYDYGNGEIRIHVWLSNGLDEFNYESSRGWWATKGYPATGIINSVSGDFN